MRRFFTGLWRVLTFPFRLIFYILALPFQASSRFYQFLNSEPDERPITEVFVDLATNSDTRQMMWDQVEVMRMHLLRALVVLALATIASFWYAEQLMEIMARPVGGLSKLQAIGPTESIGVFMRVSLMVGIAIASPYIAFEAWLFAAPGLHAREKKLGLTGIPLAAVFFLAGMFFTFQWLLPPAIDFLMDFTEVTQSWTAREYFSLVTGLMLWLGIFFEFPLVIYVLTAMGLIKPSFLAEQWRIAIVLIAIIAAAVTPTVDPVNQGLVMAPMILLYFISIGLSFIAYAGRRKADAETETVETEAGQGGA
jgi:sec-independent protein translocase protein TatC